MWIGNGVGLRLVRIAIAIDEVRRHADLSREAQRLEDAVAWLDEEKRRSCRGLVAQDRKEGQPPDGAFDRRLQRFRQLDRDAIGALAQDDPSDGHREG